LGLRDRLGRLEREADGNMVFVPQKDGTVKRFPQSAAGVVPDEHGATPRRGRAPPPARGRRGRVPGPGMEPVLLLLRVDGHRRPR
jgi:hypothetical protein